MVIKEEIQVVVDEHVVNPSDDEPELDLEPRTKDVSTQDDPPLSTKHLAFQTSMPSKKSEQ